MMRNHTPNTAAPMTAVTAKIRRDHAGALVVPAARRTRIHA